MKATHVFEWFFHLYPVYLSHNNFCYFYNDKKHCIMQIEFLQSNKSNPAILIPQIERELDSYYEWKAFQEFDPKRHKVNSKLHRPDKLIKVDRFDDDGKVVGVENKTVYKNRCAIPFQQLIVSRKTAFTTGGVVTLHAKPENDTAQDLFNEVYQTWQDNKCQFRNSNIFERLASETEVCEIWTSKLYEEDGKKRVKLRMNIFSPSSGHTLIPLFDDYGDLIAFAIKYELKDGKKTVNHMDVYDNEEITRYVKQSGIGWTLYEKEGLINPLKHRYGKIPVIYYQIPRSVWENVQPLIDRKETMLSNLADSNDYHGDPILLAKGDIEGWSDKGEQGKVIEAKGEGADLKYISHDNASQSVELEFETLNDLIYTMTQTPDISSEKMAEIGDISGVAFDRIMIDAHLDAKKYQNGVYGEGIQRRLNFLKTALSNIYPEYKSVLSMEITAQFDLFRINSDKDRLDIAERAVNAKLMSQKEGIEYIGISDDPDKTIEEIKKENITPTEP